jgi:lipoate-protein ligase A
MLHHGPGDMFMLWRNDPCVVIGKHQNALAEINHRYCREHNIPVVRRISGGGAVYHDAGNTNFSFILTVGNQNQVDFSRFLMPMMEDLRKMGLEVTTGKRNDLYVEGLKFSGNAEHVFKNKVLHHGTLLFDTDLEILNNALTPPGREFRDKAVRSVRSAVTNLKPYLSGIRSVEEFSDRLAETFTEKIPELRKYELSEEDILQIRLLADEKYRTWKWNFGYSPEFRFIIGFETNEGKQETEFKVRNGQIIDIVPITINFSLVKFENFRNILIGKQFEEQEIWSVLREEESFFEEAGIDVDAFINALF